MLLPVPARLGWDSDYLTIRDVARRLNVVPETVNLWIRWGCPIGDGVRVRLAAERGIGRKWFITHQALREFLAATNSRPSMARAEAEFLAEEAARTT